MRNLFIITAVFCTLWSQAQQPDSAAKARQKALSDSADNAYFSHATYPLIKSAKWAGVIPVAHPDEIPDPHQKYKLVLEVVTGIKDSAAAREPNGGFAEVGRLINLYIASGIPLSNLDIVVVAHGGVLNSLKSDEFYKKKYKVSNPNDTLFNELRAAGVKFIACGQAMFFLNIKKEELMPWVKVSLTAQTALTNYQNKGYLLKKIAEE